MEGGEQDKINIGWVKYDAINGMSMTRLLLTKSGH